MCRLSLYKGKPLLIGDLVTNPDNSLIFQARDAAYHPGVNDVTHRRNIVVNGDGFGVAWYGEDPLRGSCCFKFVTPAWSNANLRSIGEHVASHLICAHIRAASSGHDPLHERVAVSHENCHPFSYANFTFMHNGGIPGFNKIKLSLLGMLDEELFAEIKGSTDSEHIFMLILQFLYGGDFSRKVFSVEEMATAASLALSTIVQLCEEAEIEEACSLNICLTDGVHVLATRMRNGPQHPPSLYYNYGKDFRTDDQGRFFSSGVGRSEHLVVSSAPLSKVDACPSFSSPNCSGGKGQKAAGQACGGGSLCHPAEEDEAASDALPSHDLDVQAMEEDAGGDWILVPKDHMLIGHGDPNQLHRVLAVELRPIPLTRGAIPKSRKSRSTTAAKAPPRKSQPATSSSSVASAKASAMSEAPSAATASTGQAVYGRKPKIMRFRSKL